MSQKIAVFGIGANGSCIASNLISAGLDVVAIDQWPAHVAAVQSRGLTVTSQNIETNVQVKIFHLCDVCTIKQKFDIVLLAVKAYDTRWACEMIKPILAADGVLIGVQNAMTAETICDIVGPTRTVGCVVELASEIFTPGLVKRNTPQEKTWMGIGSLDPVVDSRLEDIRAVLSHVGKVEIRSDILSAKWTKLVINSMSLGTSAMLGTRLSEAIKLPGMRELMIEIGEESRLVGQALGYSLEPIFGLTREDFAKSNRPMELLFDKLAKDIGPGRGNNTVLQDLIKGRRSEVSLINGFVADESARRGNLAPANARIAEIVRRIEVGEISPSANNLALAIR